MKKIFKRSLLLLSVISALCFAAVGCDNGKGNSADLQPSDTQTTIDDNSQSDDEQSEQTPSGQEKPSEEEPSEQEKPSEEEPSQGSTTLPGGLVDMGNFESKQ